MQQHCCIGGGPRWPATRRAHRTRRDARRGRRPPRRVVGQREPRRDTCRRPARRTGRPRDAGWRRHLDPDRYRIVQFDQRNCGHSTPSAATTSSTCPPTPPRTCWPTSSDCASTSACAVARPGGVVGQHAGRPTRSSTPSAFGRSSCSRWRRRRVGRSTGSPATSAASFPREWEAFRDAVPPTERDGDLAAAYARLLRTTPTRRPGPRGPGLVHLGGRPRLPRPGPPAEPALTRTRAFRLAFARLVTHYFGGRGVPRRPRPGR